MKAIHVLIPCDIGAFFANAGQAEVERCLLKALVRVNSIYVTLLANGTQEEYDRLVAYVNEFDVDKKIRFRKKTSVDIEYCLQDISLVLVHSLPQGCWQLLQQMLDKTRVPVIQYIHSFLMTEFENNMWSQFWSGWNGKLKSLLVSPSIVTAWRANSIKQQFISNNQMFPPLRVIPHGVQYEHIDNANRWKGRDIFNIDDNTCLLLSLNRIAPDKCDYRQLILSYYMMVSTEGIEQKTHLAIVGGVSPLDEAYVNGLKKMLRTLKLTNQVTIITNLDENDKPDILAAADIFLSIASNPQESFGVVLLEALAAGLPVIASDWNGYREVVPSFYKPYLISTIASHQVANNLDWPYSSEACAVNFQMLTDVMCRLVRNIDERLLNSKNAKAYAREYTWDKHVETLLSTFDRLNIETEYNNKGLYDSYSHSKNNIPCSCVDGMSTDYLEPGTKLRLVSESNVKHLQSVRMKQSKVYLKGRTVINFMNHDTAPAPKKDSWYTAIVNYFSSPIDELNVVKYNSPSFKSKSFRKKIHQLFTSSGSDGVTLKEVRESYAVEAYQSDWLMIQWLRYGIIEVIKDTDIH